MISIALCWCTVQAFTQVSLPYYTGFDDNASLTGWTSYRKGSTDSQQWAADNGGAFSPAKSLVHYYPVGGSTVTDDWFVSPALLIPEGGTLDSVRYAFSGFGMPQTEDTVAIYLLNGSPDPALATGKQLLYLFTGNAYQNDNVWRLLAPLALNPANGNSYLAFRYRTTVNWLDVRFDNVHISGIGAAGISENTEEQVMLFPNPAEGTLQFFANGSATTETDFQLTLYDQNGRPVSAQRVQSGKTIDLQLAAGCYIYHLTPINSDWVKTGTLIVR